MRRIGDLFKELGFNPEAPMSTQKAFLKHLVRAAERPEPPKAPVLQTPQTAQQLSFDAEILGVIPQEPKSRKA